ncbi:MAG: SH3 domain-containing protein [Firmicutes bacterium]|nr:SH3 domain-containing protein [Bacillota bacterium]
MNFSNTYGLRKALSLLLTVLMIAAVFAGCKKETTETEPSTAPSLNLDLSDTPTTVETTVPPTTEPIVYDDDMGTVTNQITVRVIPSKDANPTGTLDAGSIVRILQQQTIAGVTWGNISEPVSGWICMDYVKMFNASSEGAVESETDPNAAESTPTQPAETDTQNTKGVVTANGLNIRDDASAAGKIVGSYSKGDVVTILETKNGWGRTSKGWIKMEYVNTTGTTGNTNTNTSTNTGSTTNTSGNGSTTVVAKGIVTASELNIRSGASTDSERVGILTYGNRVEILEKSGDWGRTSKGWISLNYVYQDGTTGSKSAKGIVTVDGLRIRSGPGTNYESVGSYNSGDRVKVLEQFTYGDTTWGCTDKGWISMSYVYVDGTDIGKTVEGTVTTDNLNIRSGPGTGYDSVGTLNTDEVIQVLYQLQVGDTTWGCTSKGWVSLKYVELSE